MVDSACRVVYLNSIAFFVGFVLDWVFGEPPSKFHPVVIVGKTISKLEPLFYAKNGGFLSGMFFVLFVLLLFCLPVFAIEIAVLKTNDLFVDLFYEIVSVYLFFSSISVKSLKKHAMDVYLYLKKGDLDKSKVLLSFMVSRDTETMDEKKVITSTVESISENFVDGILSPALYFIFFGPVGAIFFKIISTFDSMIGYKNERYMQFGRFAAIFDDVLNFIPARLSIVFILPAVIIKGYPVVSTLESFSRFRKSHSSPNSAHPMSAFAGALRINLGGNTIYGGILVKKPIIGNFNKRATVEDIRRAVDLMQASSFVVFLFGLAVFFRLSLSCGWV